MAKLTPSKLTFVSNYAVYTPMDHKQLRHLLNFKTSSHLSQLWVRGRTCEQKALARLTNWLILRLLRCILNWLNQNLVQYCNAQYTTVTSMTFAKVVIQWGITRTLHRNKEWMKNSCIHLVGHQLHVSYILHGSQWWTVAPSTELQDLKSSFTTANARRTDLRTPYKNL